MKPTDFARYLSDFLRRYLPVECGVSSNTIQAYSLAFSLFLTYMKTEECITPERLQLKDMTRQRVTDFLLWLEKERECSVSTRNARLAALHSFFRYAQYKDVSCMQNLQDIIAIRYKKHAAPEMAYLTIEGIKLLLQQPDLQTAGGRRDFALLGLLYDCGARVQELIGLTPSDLRFGETATVVLRGKGQKARVVPLSAKQVKNLGQYMKECNLFERNHGSHPLFANPQGNKLSRMAVLNILKKHTDKARSKSPGLIPDNVGCHTLRRSKAMHLLEAGINLVWIRDFLGHSSTTTTEVYARASTMMKEKALQKLNPNIVINKKTSWQKDNELMSWLKELRRKY